MKGYNHKGMDQGQYGNDRYMKMMKGSTGKVMKNHGNTTGINTDAQKFDMKRGQFLAKERKGYDNKAWEYGY